MSLLDDVSIVVTPNGYKAGELYAVVPVPTEGAELVVNGDFATDTDWTKGTGWTISGGTANCDGSQSGNTDLTQSIATSIGKQYKITYTVSNYSAGSIKIRLNSGNVSLSKSSNGTFAEVLSGQGGGFSLRADLDFIGSIDNVSVKEYTSADMDVTRATAATRVDENGLVNYAEIVSDTELVTNGDFTTDSDWTKGTGWTISGGNLNASNVNAASTTQAGYTFVGKTFQVSYTISDYSQGGVRIYLGGSQSTSLKSANGTHTETISISSGNTLVYIYGTSNFTGNIDNVSIKEVTRDNVPRIDYTGGGCPHILAEPQRTNEITYSEDFSQWNNARTTDTSNQATSPDGTNNATYLEQNTGETNAGSIYASVTLIAADYSFSIFAKKKEKDFIVAYDSNANRTYFNISNGTLGNNGSGGTSKIEDYGNGWYRCSVSYTESSAASTNIAWYLGDTNGSTTVTDSGGVYIYGCQVEEGSYPTSYIPTSGSTVTRNQDIFTRDGIGSLINSTEGVLFVEFKTLSETGTFRQFNLSKDNSNRIYITKRGDNGNLECRMENPSGNLNFSFAENTTNDFVKVAFRYGLNNFAVFIDGVNKNVTSTGNVFASGTLNTLEFDSPLSQPFFGKVKQLQVYNTALTDEQLTSLTS